MKPLPAPFFQRFWKTLIRLIGFLLCFLVITGILAAAVFGLLPIPSPFVDGNDFSDVNIWSMVVLWAILSLATYLSIQLFWVKIDKLALRPIGLSSHNFWPNFSYGTGLGVAMISIGYLLMLLFGVANLQAGTFLFFPFLGWLIFFLIQPFFEELLFRGYVLRLIERYFSTWTAIIVSSILFGLVHAPNENFSLIGLLSIGLSGLLMGWLFVRTGSLWAPTGLHFSWNFFQGVVFGYPTSGINTYQLLENQYSGPEWLSGGEFGFEGSIIAVLLLLGVFVWDWRKGETAIIADIAVAESEQDLADL
ncbi:MAG: type II CAAX endopeptidase family protein [Saprospiraceae bacterium]